MKSIIFLIILCVFTGCSSHPKITIGNWNGNAYSNPLLTKQITIPSGYKIIKYKDLLRHTYLNNGIKFKEKDLKPNKKQLQQSNIIELFTIGKPVMLNDSYLHCSIIKLPYVSNKIPKAFLTSPSDVTHILEKPHITNKGILKSSYYEQQSGLFKTIIAKASKGYLFHFEIEGPTKESLEQYIKIINISLHH